MLFAQEMNSHWVTQNKAGRKWHKSDIYLRWEIMETRDFHEAHSVGNNCFIAPETSSAMTRVVI